MILDDFRVLKGECTAITMGIPVFQLEKMVIVYWGDSPRYPISWGNVGT